MSNSKEEALKNIITYPGDSVITEFIKQTDWPQWFRGLSVFQKKAADELHMSIRDDTEQGTSHRVRTCLAGIGVSPVVSGAPLKIALRWCGGNDIAFLWFIMELCYRDSCAECSHLLFKYNINEQIIMSSIAHLDMVTTLKELDRILPPPQYKSSKQNLNLEHKISTSKWNLNKRKSSSKKSQYSLPYFEKLRRPIPYVQQGRAKPADNMLKFRQYLEYLNPNHIVLNESNRWYSKYELSSSKRVSKFILGKVFSNIFSNKEIDSTFCAAHRNKRMNKTTCARIRRVNAYNRRKNLRNGVIIDEPPERLQKDDCSEEKNKNFNTLGKATCEEIDLNLILLSEDSLSSVESTCSEGDAFKKISLACLKIDLEGKTESPKHTLVDDEACFCRYDYGHGFPVGNSLNDADKFFKAPEINKPFKFQCSQIFQLKAEPDSIRAAICKAFCCESLTRVADTEVCVEKCVANIWEKEVRRDSEKRENLRKQEELEKEMQLKSPLNYNFKYIDPRDSTLMNSMLLDAMKYMRKNRKFVLASMPEAHKLPLLHEWIRVRYGLTYSETEKREAGEISRRIFERIKAVGMNVGVPQNEFGKINSVSYGCRDFFTHKTNLVRSKYYHNFKSTHLEEVRILWIAMSPYQWIRGPPKDTFFAYLPSNARDILMYRPWKRTEFIDLKAVRERRKYKTTDGTRNS